MGTTTCTWLHSLSCALGHHASLLLWQKQGRSKTRKPTGQWQAQKRPRFVRTGALAGFGRLHTVMIDVQAIHGSKMGIIRIVHSWLASREIVKALAGAEAACNSASMAGAEQGRRDQED